jgi:hypothetical protein
MSRAELEDDNLQPCTALHRVSTKVQVASRGEGVSFEIIASSACYSKHRRFTEERLNDEIARRVITVS